MSHTEIWEKHIPGRENSKNKGPELGKRESKDNKKGLSRDKKRSHCQSTAKMISLVTTVGTEKLMICISNKGR